MKNNKVKSNDFATLKRVVKLAFPFKKLFLLSIFFAIFTALITAVRPFIIQHIIDVNIIEQNGKGLGIATMILFTVIFSEFILKYFFGINTTKLGQSIMLALRSRLLT